MVMEEQAEIARTFVGNKASACQINSEIENMDRGIRDNACLDIHAVAAKGPKAMKKSMGRLAKKLNVDPATLYCIYMDWKSKIR